jgi:DNA replication and repair protein RecF
VYIKSLALQNFRNHKDTFLKLSQGINVIIGDNAQGKTNLLEAIYLTCVGRGFRSPKDRDLIKFDEDIMRVKTTVSKNYGDTSIEIVLSSVSGRSGKQIKIDEIPIRRIGELIGNITCIFFNPDELKLIKEAPADRRRFMDIDISQIDKIYFYNLLKYNKILQQRNALLKIIASAPQNNSVTNNKMLDVWDEQIATVASEITARRATFINMLRPLVSAVHKTLASQENIDIIYNNIDNILMKFKESREKDIRLKTTTIGPHRDDLTITINGKNIHSFASQGQQRTAALSIKLAELKVFENTTGEKPILLLDDVLSELDTSRQEKLLNAITGYQSIITAATFNSDINLQLFKIQNGKLA